MKQRPEVRSNFEFASFSHLDQYSIVWESFLDNLMVIVPFDVNCVPDAAHSSSLAKQDWLYFLKLQRPFNQSY